MVAKRTPAIGGKDGYFFGASGESGAGAAMDRSGGRMGADASAPLFIVFCQGLGLSAEGAPEAGAGAAGAGAAAVGASAAGGSGLPSASNISIFAAPCSCAIVSLSAFWAT